MNRARAPSRLIAPESITADELLWADRDGICDVFPAERIERTGQLRIDAAVRSDALRRLFADPGYTSTPVSFARLSDIQLDLSFGICATRDLTLIEETLIVPEAFDPSLAMIDSIPWAFDTVVTEPILHCFHRSTPAYGHFIFDCLSAIVWFRDAILAERIKVLYPPWFPDWGLDVLAGFGMHPDRHLMQPTDPVIACRHIVIPTIIDTANTFFPNRGFCTGPREALTAGIPRPARTRHIYLSRLNQTNYSNRSIDNEAAVRRTLERLGFAILEPGNMSFAAQTRAFNDAAVIVGGHGSTFGNLIAAQPGATVIDLIPDQWIGFWDKVPAERWVLHMTSLFGLDYVPVLCRSSLVDPNQSDDVTARRAKGMHYEVDLELLKRVAGRAQDQDYQAREG